MKKKNGSGSEEVAQAEEAPVVREVSKKKLVELFKAYARADEAVAEAKKGVDTAIAARSDAVRAIADYAGKGPFGHGGDVLKVVSRGELYYFRGRAEQEVTQID
jgi:hypothetical protein